MCEDLNGLVLDVKCGSGAFMRDQKQAEGLASSLVETCKKMNVECTACINRMDYPLGEWIGNACEVYECL